MNKCPKCASKDIKLLYRIKKFKFYNDTYDTTNLSDFKISILEKNVISNEELMECNCIECKYRWFTHCLDYTSN
jgi:hypothetical protein